ncbi:MAG TPA: kelch repeat-containing protein [Candidatus Limnocylindria bacterium]|nr:kelch repeat-containing protein [Candidatus Limnocylindria bacterium]
MTRIASVLALALVIVGLAWMDAPTVARGDAVRWSSFAELQRPRAFASAIGLPSGEILVLGGLDPRDADVTNPRTELIDQFSGSVALLPQTILARLLQTVTLGAGERVVVAGGVVWEGPRWAPVARVDVYEVARRSWRAAAPLHSARSDAAAAALKDGRVAVFGGNFGTRLLDTVEIYDPRRDAWTEGAPMPRPRTQHSAVLLKDGRVLIAGGIDKDGGPTATTFLYDPSANAWTAGPLMTQPRMQQSTVLLANGDVLFAGGDDAAASTSELFLASEGRFVASGALQHPRFVAQAAALPDGRVVLNGGLPPHMTTYAPLGSTEIWDPRTGKWREVAPAASPRAWAKLISIEDAVFLVSGSGPGEDAVSSVERLTLD